MYMGAHLIRFIGVVVGVTIAVVHPSVRAQTAPAPAIETPTPPSAGLHAPTSEADTPAAAASAAAPPLAATSIPGAEKEAVEGPPATAPPGATPILRAELLDQFLAPIALYPDALLAQILMAATYPLEVVKASRWFQDARHAALSGDQLAAALEAETWDPSVKALMTFPQILMMLDANLDWTEQLGEAFAAQQSDVMDAIQRLRQQAAAAGTLWSNAQQRVTEEGQGIVIEPENPAYIYPPHYNPALAYGPWPSPEYPPFDILPPDFGIGSTLPLGITFGPGFFVVNKIWRWSAFDWRQRQIRINAHGSQALDRPVPGSESSVWRHDPPHRQRAAFFEFDARARLGMSPNRATSVVAIPRIGVPRVVAAPPVVLSRPAPVLWHPAPRPVLSARARPVASALPDRQISRRPVIMPQAALRQPAGWTMPHAVAASTGALAPGGGTHFDGVPRR
jgi:hypothetical protein